MGEWKESTLGDVSIDGGHYGIAASAVPLDASLPTYLRITDIRDDGTINKSGLTSVDDPNSVEYILSPNDLVIARTGASTGRNYFYDGRDGELVYAGFLIKFSIDPNKIYPQYVKYWFLSPFYKAWLNSHTDGSTRANINAVTLADCPIRFPADLPTQRRIAAVLGALDDTIEVNRKICENLEAQAQALFKAWFVDFEPFGGKRPEGWKMGKLGDVAVYYDGKIDAAKLSPATYFSTENMLANREGTVDAETVPQSGMVPLCDEGCVLVSNIRPYFKKIIRMNCEGGHSPDVLCFKAKTLEWQWYLYRMLWDDAFFAYVMSSTKGTKMPRGDKGHIMDYPCVLPLDNDIRKFNDTMASFNGRIEVSNRESRALAAMRDALLPKLMSGELAVEKVEVK